MITDWMPALKSYLAQLEGVRQVWSYDDLPGALMDFPCFVVMPYRGTESYSAGNGSLSYHFLRLDYYLSGQLVPEANLPAVEMIGRLRNHLARNVTLHGLVDDISPLEDNWYEGPGGLNFNYGSQQHLGIRFNVQVKERESISVTAQPGG